MAVAAGAAATTMLATEEKRNHPFHAAICDAFLLSSTTMACTVVTVLALVQRVWRAPNLQEAAESPCEGQCSDQESDGMCSAPNLHEAAELPCEGRHSDRESDGMCSPRESSPWISPHPSAD
mmetsp:Transcript_113654/g.220458  ORF Transcript_113654/g.220458 Transcript_113654/m.220458 type:complete len:122 (-) Transcript_113654:1527-1892(-)